MTKTTTALSRDRAKAGMLAIRDVAMEVQKEIMESEGFEKSIAIATGLVAIHDAFTDDTVAVLMSLMGTDIGFKADKTDYPVDTIKQAAIRALMHGAYLHGNEFNVIAGQCYLTQAYFLRKLREYPGLTDLIIDVEAPSDGVEKGRQVELRVGGYGACKVDGKPVEVYCRNHPKYGDQRLTVVAFGGDIDQAMGKAKKRIAQKLYERIAGVTLSDEPSEAASVRVVEPTQISQQDSAGEETQEHPDDHPQVDWAAEFKRYGVIEQAALLRDAPTADDRKSVLAAAKDQLASKKIDQRGYEWLQRYAATKD